MNKHPERTDSHRLRDPNQMTDYQQFRPKPKSWRSTRLGDNEVRIGISAPSAKVSNAVARVCFAPGVLKTLRWQRGDRLVISFDSEYLFLRRTPKPDEGFVLHRASKSSKVHLLAFRLYRGMPFWDIRTTQATRKVDWIPEEDGALICWPERDDD